MLLLVCLEGKITLQSQPCLRYRNYCQVSSNVAAYIDKNSHLKEHFADIQPFPPCISHRVTCLYWQYLGMFFVATFTIHLWPDIIGVVWPRSVNFQLYAHSEFMAYFTFYNMLSEPMQICVHC